MLRYTSSNLGSDDWSVMVSSLLAACFSMDMPFCTTSEGSLDSASLTLFCISTAARSGSVLLSKVTVAVKEPVLVLVDSIYIIPGVPFSSCSMGVATACDTASALAPGYEAEILT